MKNKNILYFTRTMALGGTEKVILQLCKIMKPEFNKIIVCSCGGVNVEELNKMGIRHYVIPDIEKKDIITVLTIFRIILKIIKNEGIDIIHTHHRMAAFYTRVLGYIRTFTFIHTSHNTFKDKKRFTKFALEVANIVAVGNKVKDNLCNFYGMTDSQILVIHNAIEEFEGPIVTVDLLQKYKKEGYFLVGNIGRLSKQKGMEYYIKSIPMVLKRFNKIKFFIAGTGEDEEQIKELITDLNLENNLILLGYRNDIQNIMSQLDLIVLSSLWEGLPLTPIEAFSVGKTVVATSVDGTVEIVKNDVNGILVEPRESEQIADAIIKVYEHPQKLKEFESNALITYKQEFSYNVLKSRYIKFYNGLMG